MGQEIWHCNFPGCGWFYLHKALKYFVVVSGGEVLWKVLRI